MDSPVIRNSLALMRENLVKFRDEVAKFSEPEGSLYSYRDAARHSLHQAIRSLDAAVEELKFYENVVDRSKDNA